MKTSNKNIFILFILAVFTMLQFTSCEEDTSYEEKWPFAFVGSTWESEDGTLSFKIDEEHHGIGKFTVHSNNIDIFLTFGRLKEIEFYPLESYHGKNTMLYPEEIIISGYCEYETDKFTLTVEENKILDENIETIVFYRTDDPEPTEPPTKKEWNYQEWLDS